MEKLDLTNWNKWNNSILIFISFFLSSSLLILMATPTKGLNWNWAWSPSPSLSSPVLPTIPTSFNIFNITMPTWPSPSFFSLTEMFHTFKSRPWTTFFVTLTTIGLASEIIYYFVKMVKKRRAGAPGVGVRLKSTKKLKLTGAEYHLEKRKPGHVWNTVIFFPDPTPTLPDSPTHQLIFYLDQARTSIHLCVYLVSHPWFTEVIGKKYEEGLLVQVVTDYDTSTAHNNFGPKKWRRSGMEVRMKSTGFLMHHKFAVIDEEAVLTGSLNWTKQGAAWNQENVLVSTNPLLVKPYLEEFHNLWRFCRNDEVEEDSDS